MAANPVFPIHRNLVVGFRRNYWDGISQPPEWEDLQGVGFFFLFFSSVKNVIFHVCV